MRDAGRLQPIAQSLEITGHRPEGTDLLGRPLTRRAGQHTRHHRLLMHIQPSTSLDNHLHHCLPRQKGDRDAAGTIKTLPHVLPVPRGDKEWYLYATPAGLIIGVANHRRVVSLNTIARREVRTIRPAPQLKTAQPPPPFSPIVVRATRWLADQQSLPTACAESPHARSPCARADHPLREPTSHPEAFRESQASCANDQGFARARTFWSENSAAIGAESCGSSRREARRSQKQVQ